MTRLHHMELLQPGPVSQNPGLRFLVEHHDPDLLNPIPLFPGKAQQILLPAGAVQPRQRHVGMDQRGRPGLPAVLVITVLTLEIGLAVLSQEVR